MAKIIVDDKDIVDPASMKVLEKLAEFFTRLDDPYKMPDYMVQWLERQHTGVDIYYQSVVGYGHEALSVRWTFKKTMLVMEFLAPDGMRLMELRLHV